MIRPQVDELHDYRGYAGRIVSGIYRKGDEVVVLPAGLKSKIKAIELGGKEVEEAFAPQSVVLHLEDDIDISRGDLIVPGTNLPSVENELDVLICWMDTKPMLPGNKYMLQLGSKVVKSVVKEIEYQLDVNSLQKIEFPGKAGLNDVVKARIKTASPIAFDSYENLRVNGGAILIDETSHVTVGACMIQ
ncbi:MAG: elongation factor 1-alpha C-terminal domain-related protein [Flavitalea sp.]